MFFCLCLLYQQLYICEVSVYVLRQRTQLKIHLATLRYRGTPRYLNLFPFLKKTIFAKNVVSIGKDIFIFIYLFILRKANLRFLQIICKHTLDVFHAVVFVEEEFFARNTQSEGAVIKRAWTCIQKKASLVHIPKAFAKRERDQYCGAVFCVCNPLV